ncbi:MAG: TonB-dependent receptor, partial [Acidobacteria bacterium]|nr:TonB-dependent receptor [Acidobacteriota bacterium]
MKRTLRYLSGILLTISFVSASVFAQSSNATLGGTVADASRALIPGVTVTATNNGTGIVTTTITNETGAYQFAALQPGIYRVGAELPGFRTGVYNDVSLGISQQVRLNFTLEVGGQAQTVEVAVAADTLIATTSASVGSVLPEYKVRDLPLINRDVLALVSATTPGVRGTAGGITFAGATSGMINTTRDGISVQQGRYNNGVYAATFSSPDLVEEVRVIVTPADAETGRGSGQVQMRTRSGTNDLRGSLFWTNRNSIWDANTFANNFNKIEPDYLNRNQFGGRLGGPLARNRTFFFFLYEGMRTVERSVTTATVLTDTARQGIYRYFPNVPSANANGTRPTVDQAGNPVLNGQPATPESFNVLAQPNGQPRDPNRTGPDPSGMIQRLIAIMPSANDFNTGDGLNTAGHRFVRHGIGAENFTGQGQNINRNSVNLRLDHLVTSKHKLSAVASRERTWADTNVAAWPGGINGDLRRQPQVYTASFVSTLSPTLLNEFRFGLRRDRLLWTVAYDIPGKEGDEARKWLGQTAGGYPFIFRPILFANNIVNYAGNGGVRNVNPLWQYGNNISWTKGKHAFKGGVDFRFGATNEWTAQSTVPRVDTGPTTSATGRQYNCSGCGIPVTGIDNVALRGISGPDQTRARDLLLDLSGSIGSINQQFDVLDPRNIVYEDYTTSYPRRWDDIHQNEFSAFFKDDWKIRPSLTLNLGMRYDWYGVPYEGHGLGASVTGGGLGLFGISGRSWADWMRPGVRGDLMTLEFVGKNSPNPDKQFYPDDWNNFGPAIGLSWSLPWFGKDKTVVRAGYGVFYQGILTGGGGGLQLDFAIGYSPGMSQIATHRSSQTGELSIRNIVLPIPERLPAGKIPTIPLDQPILTSNTFGFDPSLVNPYIQNFNLEIQRELRSNLTLEVRYVGTKGTKLFPGGNFSININTPNTIENGILEAFNITRSGGNAQLFNQMLNGITVPGAGRVNGTTLTGSQALRQSSVTRGFLANGDPSGLANYLARQSPTGGRTGDYVRTNGFPENFIVANPQLGPAVLWTNTNNSTYHSLNVSVTKRLSQGFTNQTTYTWSRALGTNIINPRERG